MNNGYSIVVVLILFSFHLISRTQPTKHYLKMTMYVGITQLQLDQILCEYHQKLQSLKSLNWVTYRQVWVTDWFMNF